MEPKSDRSLVIAFAAPVGVNLTDAEDATEKKLKECGYHVVRIRVTRDVLPKLDPTLLRKFPGGDFERFNAMMDAGNLVRENHGNSVIALGVAATISLRRRDFRLHTDKVAYLVHSLKHPDEVRLLRKIYSNTFYLIGVHSPPDDRRDYLTRDRKVTEGEAKKLMDRDRKESKKHGQRLIDTFHLSDFFVGWRYNDDKRHLEFMENNIARFLEVVFGHPNRTPTFGEYAMFLAFSAALRSADLSRQVGAVITKGREILGTGANDCPRAGGGLYWPTLNHETLKFEDHVQGRDWTRNVDWNRRVLKDMKVEVLSAARSEFDSLLNGLFLGDPDAEEKRKRLRAGLHQRLNSVLEASSINDLTEFGRMVHAEMEALLSCARKGVSTKGATLFSTTFPCHNCAKHIVASGVKKVVFVEPYLKSKAGKMHNDSIVITYADPIGKKSEKEADSDAPKLVEFEPFVGVGPRRFFDLFSMNLGIADPLIRKDDDSGVAKSWNPNTAKPRIGIGVESFLDREESAAEVFQDLSSKTLSKGVA